MGAREGEKVKRGFNICKLTIRTKIKIFENIWIQTQKGKKLGTKIKIIGIDIIFKLPHGNSDGTLHHPHHDLTDANQQ